MLHPKRRTNRLLLSTCLSGLLLLASMPMAWADSTTATTTVSAGSLTESNATTPAPSVTLDGTDQTATYSLTITVTDATGSGNGWNLTITSTTFTTGGGSPYTLSTTASHITGVTSSCVANTTCTNPTNALTYPIGVPAAGTAPTAVKIFKAAADTGLGTFTVTPSVAIAVPADTYAGSYSSTVTLAIVSGP